MGIDLMELEAQFAGERLSSEMDNVMYERLQHLTQRIADLEGIIQFRKDHQENLEDSVKEIARVIHITEEFLRSLRRRRDPIEREIDALKKYLKGDRMRIKGDEPSLAEAQRELAKLLAEIEDLKRLEAEAAEIDSATKESAWREWAKPYQIEGAKRLTAARRGILGDAPGLGKTGQSIMTIEMLRARGQGNRVLILTLKPVIPDFVREVQKWFPGQYVQALDQGRQGKNDVLGVVKYLPQAIVITNYESWRRSRAVLEGLVACQFDTLILDEAHVCKDPKSLNFRSVRELVFRENQCNSCKSPIHADETQRMKAFERGITDTYLSAKCPKCEAYPSKFYENCSIKNVYSMTGTIILNRPQEMWPLLNLTDPVAWPTESAFLNSYCTKQCFGCGAKSSTFCECEGAPHWGWKFKPGGSEVLLKKLGMKYTGRTAQTAGVDLPEQQPRHHWLEMDPDPLVHGRQLAFVNAMREQAIVAFGDAEMTLTHTLQWYTYMRQAALWPDAVQIKDKETGELLFPPPGVAAVGQSAIMDKTEELIQDAIDSDQRIVAFCSTRRPLEEIRRRCEARGLRVAMLVGGMNDRDRSEVIDDFNTKHTAIGEHKFDVLLSIYSAGGTGLSLSGAHQMVLMDREWNSGKEKQAVNRIRRLDSKHDTIVHILHCEDTATELIDKLILMKDQMLDEFEGKVNLIEEMRKFLRGEK